MKMNNEEQKISPEQAAAAMARTVGGTSELKKHLVRTTSHYSIRAVKSLADMTPEERQKEGENQMRAAQQQAMIHDFKTHTSKDMSTDQLLERMAVMASAGGTCVFYKHLRTNQFFPLPPMFGGSTDYFLKLAMSNARMLNIYQSSTMVNPEDPEMATLPAYLKLKETLKDNQEAMDKVFDKTAEFLAKLKGFGALPPGFMAMLGSERFQAEEVSTKQFTQKPKQHGHKRSSSKVEVRQSGLLRGLMKRAK